MTKPFFFRALILGAIVLPTFLFSQTTSIPKAGSNGAPSNEASLTVVDEDAVFRGGLPAMYAFIQNEFVYPEFALENDIEGRVFVRFVVERSGKISNIEILSGINGCVECDEEVIRVISIMPKWIPAKVNGKKVRTYIVLPFNFALQ